MFQQSVKFGDCIISKDGNGIRITPIRLAKKNISIYQDRHFTSNPLYERNHTKISGRTSIV